MAGEASACGERVRELGRQARDRINADDPRRASMGKSEARRRRNAAAGYASTLDP
jgi:hypothetical protein